MDLVWKIPFKKVEHEIHVKSLDVFVINSIKEKIEVDIIEQLNNKNLKIKWVELDEVNNYLILPDSDELAKYILKIEPIERNPRNKSFNGKIIKPNKEEVIKYG